MDKNLLSLIIIVIIAKAIAFGRELLLAYFYGASVISDLYIMSLTLPLIVTSLISNGIVAGFIPIFTNIKINYGIDAGKEFVNKILSLCLLFCTVFLLWYFIFNFNIVNVLAKGFDSNEKMLTEKYMNIAIFAVYFSCITYIICAYLQANGQIMYFGILSIPLNIVLIICIYISAKSYNGYFLPIGYLCGCIAQSILYILVAKKNGLNLKVSLQCYDSQVLSFVKKIWLLMIGSSVSQINIIVDKMLASHLGTGTIASLEYASRVIDLISGIVILSISAIQYPKMVSNISDNTEYMKSIQQGIISTLVILLPIIFIVIAYSSNIVQLIYGRGAFDQHASTITSQILFYYGLGLFAIGVREIYSKAFYAQLDMKTPLVNAIICVVINVVLNFILVEKLGVGGLALATSIANFVAMILLYIQLSIKYPIMINIFFKKEIIQIGIVSIVALIISHSVYHVLQYTNKMSNLNFMYILIIHFVVYLLILIKIKIINLRNLG